MSPWALVAVWGLNGLQQHFMQDHGVEMYGANKPTALGKSMMGVAGQTMILATVYMACLVKGKSQAEAFAASRGPSAGSSAPSGRSPRPTTQGPKTGPSCGP